MSFRILAVDDSSMIRAAVRRSFARFDCEVFEAADGVQGLEAVREHRPDLVVLDYNMPVLDGIGMLEQLRRDPAIAGTRVIMLTANALPTSIAAVARLGVRDYLIKPFDEQALITKVTRLVPLVLRQDP